MRLPLCYYGHPSLRKKCVEVEKITPEIRSFIQDMFDTVDAHKGLGLSACQVGRTLRIFVLHKYIIHPDGHWELGKTRYVYINPKISEPSEETDLDNEGCLSIPGIREDVERPYSITVEALDLDGKPFTERLEGYNARAIMHENDHLNGVLFVDRLDKATRQKLEPRLHAIKKKFCS